MSAPIEEDSILGHCERIDGLRRSIVAGHLGPGERTPTAAYDAAQSAVLRRLASAALAAEDALYEAQRQREAATAYLAAWRDVEDAANLALVRARHALAAARREWRVP